jgi:eukaryotic-like serine/threonine-protein kinase
MTPERWKEVKKVLAAALERAPEERRVYLDKACNEPELRREVESLIAANEQVGSGFMEQPILNSGLLERGAQLGPYTILGRIGSGGMGEVYRAHDPKLKRDVAIKVLPVVFVNDPERLARFQREARMLASLNHTNIATIHGLEQSDGIHYLVMELIPGQSLAERLRAGALPVKEVLDLSIQVIDALDSAHAKGIIHRDIKPANIVLTPRGQAKILDFGLAKLTRSPAAGLAASVSTAHPFDESQSLPGTLLGTIAYMSPEQARGEELDVRTDLFSFGLVVYEMATGRAAFTGNSPGVIFDAILNRQPVPPSQLNRAVPLRLEEIISRALEKDRKLRYQTAQDLEAELQRLKRDTESGTASKPGPISRRGTRLYRKLSLSAAGVALAVLLLLLAGLLLELMFGRSLEVITNWLVPPSGIKWDRVTNDGRPKFPGSFYPIVTDGERLYFTEMTAGNLNLAQVSTGGGETFPTTMPFERTQIADISLDHSELLVLGFTGGSESEAPMWILPTLKGTPRRVPRLEAHDAAWAPDGEIVYANGSDLHWAKADGTESRNPVPLHGRAFWLRFGPHGDKLRFTVLDPGTKSTSLWEISRDGSNLHPLLLGWNAPAAECCGNWSPDGSYYAFQSWRNGRADIWALREKKGISLFSNRTPQQITQGPLNFLAPVFSLDGKALFVVGEQRRGEVARYEAKAHQFLPYFSGISADCLDFSADGQWVTYVSYPDGTLWRSKIDGSEGLQLTSPPLDVLLPRWAPDGRQIAFSGSKGDEPSKIYVISADGGLLETLPSPQWQREPNWSADGGSLLFSGFEGSPTADNIAALYVFDLRKRVSSQLPGSAGYLEPRWSPDGRYIAAATLDSQKLVLYETKTKKWADLAQLEIGFLNWSRDSKYLYADTVGTNPWIVRIRVPDGTMEKVANLAGLRRASGTLGAWSGLAPDNSPLVTLDAGIQEIYAIHWPSK